MAPEHSFSVPTHEIPQIEARIPESALHVRSRTERQHYIAQLDPEKECQEISYLLSCYEFPWDTTRSLELALFRVFGIAETTRLLAETGEFEKRTQKRYDDTVLILSEILENGYDSPRGKAALRRMNEQHKRFTIPNDEFLYTLSTFVFEPIRWNDRFGWRPLQPNEKQASYYFWREIGQRMAIKDIPESYEAFEQYNIEYERTRFRYTDDNHRIAVATRNLMLGWVLPRFLRPIGAPFMHALIDKPLLQAVGLRPAPGWLQAFVMGTMKIRATVLALLPPRQKARLLTRMKNRTYPNGYSIDRLGADKS